jgi:hypothetical protein
LEAVQLLPKEPLVEVQLPALQLAAAFEGVEEGLGQLSGQLGLLQELGRSAALQEFLAGASTEDLRRLVDGAEDHSEHGAYLLHGVVLYSHERSDICCEGPADT